VVKAPRLDELRAALAAMRTAIAAAADRVQVRVAIDLDPVNMM